MNFLENRLSSYRDIERVLKSKNQVEKCGLESFDYTLIGSESSYGIVFKLTLREMSDQKLVVKVTGYDEDAQNESEYYEMFKEDVLENRIPHFPLVWETLDCVEKCYFIDPEQIADHFEDSELIEKWEKVKENNCYLLFAELFDGDVTRVFRQVESDELRLKLTLTMICQTVMGLNQLESEGLCHNDLHTGNVLYSHIEKGNTIKDEKKYLKYVMYDGDIIHICHYNTLFVLWDFGKAGFINSYRNPYADVLRLLKSFKHMKTVKKILSKLSEDFIKTYEEDEKRGGEFRFRKQNLMRDLLKELSKLPEFHEVVIFNGHIDTQFVTATFYPDGKPDDILNYQELSDVVRSIDLKNIKNTKKDEPLSYSTMYRMRVSKKSRRISRRYKV
jgi:hypothetical protein